MCERKKCFIERDWKAAANLLMAILAIPYIYSDLRKWL